MKLPTLDLGIVVAYVVISLAAGLWLSRRGTRSMTDYFVGGRSLPWWLAGTSMVASAFAIDTPFGITGLVAKNGVSGVWFAWTYAIGGAGTFGAFVFASLIRRSDIITAAELIELRYSGRSAAVLRGIKGVYFGVLSLAITMGWVIRSVLVVCQEALGWNVTPTLILIIILTISYTTAAGFWGVAITDFMQFFVGAIGSVALAYYAMRYIGGADGLRDALALRYGPQEAATRLQFVPRPDGEFFSVFLVFITLKWWGNPPGSVTQRVLSTRDERHATFSMMLFSVVHFAINYWPMILTALVSLAVYVDIPLDKAEQGYAKLLMEVLPTGVLGIMMASLTAAFMSTIDTQANNGASFMVNDLYRRFIKRDGDTRHYVRASQVCTVIMLLLALVMFYFMTSVRAAWEYLATMTAGYGFVAVARWFWWRVNAWSEMTALLGSALGSLLANHSSVVAEYFGLDGFGPRFLFVAVISMTSWVLVALVTPPSSMEQLATFARKVRPYPLFWGPVRERYPDIQWSPQLGRSAALWGVGLVCVYLICFGLGNLLLGSSVAGCVMLALAAVLMVVIVRYWQP